MKRMLFKKIYLFIFFFYFVSLSSAAHFIAGNVNNSYDGTSPDGMQIIVWENSNMSNNISDIIGPTGNSGASNFYMVDCELFIEPCQIGDILTVKVFNDGSGYQTKYTNVTVTGSGFDFVNSIILNSPPIANYLIVDDDIASPSGEIDLIAGGSREISCNSEIYDYENDSIISLEASFFHNSISFYSDSDNNNYHYTNNTCFSSYLGNNVTFVNCTYNLEYYSNFGDWNCTINLTDSTGVNILFSNDTFVNKLLSFSIPGELDYGFSNSENVSDELILNVSNYGNVALNLSLEGYAVTQGDGFSMNCTSGQNISVDYQKYNLTQSNPGDLNLIQFESFYKNLTSSTQVNYFNLSSRQDDFSDDTLKESYWRIYAPTGVTGTCSGNIIFGATEASSS